jgi:hypothetical protein
MHIHRGIWIGILIAIIGSGSFSLAKADTINILSRRYHVHAEESAHVSGFPGVESSEQDIVTVVFPTITATANLPDIGGLTSASVIGGVGPSPVSSGYLSANAFSIAGSLPYALATASIDFQSTDAVSLSLLTSGGLGDASFGDNYVRLTDLTDGLVLLDFHGNIVPVFRNDLADSFTFQLDPTKTYRLEVGATVDTNDGASARVDFNVPEPSSFVLLAPGLAALLIVQKKHLHPSTFFLKLSRPYWNGTPVTACGKGPRHRWGAGCHCNL